MRAYRQSRTCTTRGKCADVVRGLAPGDFSASLVSSDAAGDFIKAVNGTSQGPSKVVTYPAQGQRSYLVVRTSPRCWDLVPFPLTGARRDADLDEGGDDAAIDAE
jgi:hypothetical protein